jgi:hypothetical protein
MPIGSMHQVSLGRLGRVAADKEGSWIIHPMLILLGKVLVGALPGMTQDLSWTVTNLGYMAVSQPPLLPSISAKQQVSFLMFHHVTGVPFEQA